MAGFRRPSDKPRPIADAHPIDPTTYNWLGRSPMANSSRPVMPVVAMIGEFLYRITEPALRPIRQLLPNFGGIDISPLVLILIIYFIDIVIIGNLREAFS